MATSDADVAAQAGGERVEENVSERPQERKDSEDDNDKTKSNVGSSYSANSAEELKE